MRSVVFVTALTLLCSRAAMAAPFTGGGFETPVRANGRTDYVIQDGWTTYTGGTVNPQVQHADGTFTAPEGLQYVQVNVMTTANKWGGFRQTFDVISGATYTIKGWYRPLSGSVTAGVGVDLTGGTTRPSVWGASLAGSTSTAWNQFQFQVTATGSRMTLFLDNYATVAGKASAFDGIQVVPEPASLLVLLSGLCGLVGCGLGRRR